VALDMCVRIRVSAKATLDTPPLDEAAEPLVSQLQVMQGKVSVDG